MPYREGLAERVRAELGRRRDVVERRMFGGLAFMVRGHMCCGVLGDDLVVRVDPEAYGALVRRPHARPMDFTGRALKGLVYVGPAGTGRAASLARWVGEGLRRVEGLPVPRPRVRSTRGRTAR